MLNININTKAWKLTFDGKFYQFHWMLICVGTKAAGPGLGRYPTR
jgi:hypothetical protein